MEEYKIATFDKLPKSVKKTVRYINQDINSIESLQQIEEVIMQCIKQKRIQLHNKVKTGSQK